MDDGNATTLRRIRDNKRTGAYDVQYYRDLLDIQASMTPRSGLDGMAEVYEGMVAADCTTWDACIKASETDILPYLVLLRLCRRLLKFPTWLGFAAQIDGTGAFAAAKVKLTDWMLEVLEGKRHKPRRSSGRDERYYLLRDARIVATIEGLVKLDFPVYSETNHRSACHVVADCLNLSPETILTIWKHRQRVRKRIPFLGGS